MSRARTLPIAVALAFGASTEAHAQFAPGWQVSGTNTARGEHYSVSGDRTQSPYQQDLGSMAFDEFNITGRLQETPYAFSRFLIAGVMNGSPYRSPYDGIVPERLNFVREDGDASLPFRVEAGDFFAFTSLRTQQRSLKGGAVELQPIASNPDVRHSVVLFAGTFQPQWRGAQWGDDNTIGASYLLEHANFGRLNVNVMRNERAAQETFGMPRREQLVGSIAGEIGHDFGGWKLRLEGEAAAFKGDHEFGATSTEAVDRKDTGLYAQLSGFNANWNWRVRGERYGKDYRPNGAVVPPDRESFEAHLSYLFNGGLTLRGRYQDYSDQFESANPLDVKVLGGNLSGPIGPLGLNVMLDAYVQDQERRDRSLDSRFTSANLSLTKSFAGGLVGQAFLVYLDNDNKANSNLDSTTSQAQASVIVPFSLGGFQGSVAPGLLYRNVTGTFGTKDWQPTVMLSAFGGAHRLNLNLGALQQDPRNAVMADVDTVNFALDYRYRFGMHEVGADWIVYDRKPSPGESTRAYRVGVFWTVFLDQALAPASAPTVAPVAVAPLTVASVVRTPDLLVRLAPGADLEEAVGVLASGGIGGGVRQPNAVVYETRLLGDVEQRQRLVLAHVGPMLERSALIVSLADQATGDDASRTYERVRRALLDRFGNPSFTFDEGTFGPAFAVDLAAGRFIRLTEWQTQAGNTIRLGIPRRLDGGARIEIHHARRFPSPRDTNWGLDAVR